MLGLAHKLDLSLSGLLRLGFGLHALSRRHHLLDSFRESEVLRKAGLPHADLCGSGRKLQTYANVWFAWRIVLRCDSPPERLHRV